MLTDLQRLAVLIRDRFRCAYCGYRGTFLIRANLEVDHKIPLSRGGSDFEWNLQTICASCNEEKGDKTDAEYRAFLSVRRILLVS